MRVIPGRRVSPPGRGCGCQLRKSGSGGGPGLEGLPDHGGTIQTRGRQELGSVSLDCCVGT